MKAIKIIFVVTVLLLMADPLQAQMPYFQTYNLLRKNESVSIYDLMQDNDGYIWAGTTRGLFRFDGKGFKRFTMSEGLADDHVTAVAADGFGNVWAGHKNGKISILRDGQVKPFAPEEGNANAPVSDILFDKDGILWFGTLNDGLYYFVNQRLYRLDEAEGMPDLYIYDLHEDPRGFVVAGTDGGMVACKLDKTAAILNVLDYNDGIPDNIIKKFAAGDSTHLWIGTEDKGIVRYDLRSGTFELTIPDWRYGSITDFVVRGDELWIACAHTGIVVYNTRSRDTRLLNADAHGTLPAVLTLINDSEGNLWMGTKSALVRSPGTHLEFLTAMPGIRDANILATTEDRQGAIWFSNSDGLFRMKKGPAGEAMIDQQPAQSALQAFTVISLYVDDRGMLWAGLYGEGVLEIDPATGNARHYSKELRNGNVLGVTGKGDEIWLATLGGATRIRIGDTKHQFANFGSGEGLASDFIYQVFMDSRNRVWFATDGKGVNVLEKERFLHYEAGLPSRTVYAVAEDKQGTIWVNVQGNGVYRFTGDGFAPAGKDLPVRNNDIFTLSSDRDGNMIVSHDRGIDIIDTEKRRAKYLGDESGLKDKIVNLNAASVTSAGILYFGSTDGIIRYANAGGHLDRRPLARIERQKVFDKDVDLASAGKLSYDENNLTFAINGLWYQNPQDILFRYKLENYDHDWINTRDNAVIYSQLPPGSYTFRVMASETEDFASSPETTLSFNIAPPFWRTYTFYILVTLVVAAAGYGYVKYRERKLRHDNLILEARVRRRTMEVQRQHDEIQAQNEEIMAQAEEISGINENLEQLVKQRTAELERKNKALEEYAFINAHKLRSPVATILGLINLISRTNLDHDGTEINKRLQQAGEELDNVVRSITKAIESGENQYPFLDRKNQDKSVS